MIANTMSTKVHAFIILKSIFLCSTDNFSRFLKHTHQFNNTKSIN